MWKAAIQAVKDNNDSWIRENRITFSEFFAGENLKPQGRLNSAALKIHYQERLFKMFLSKEYKGLELPLHIGSKWIKRASVLDANWGWLLAIGVGGAYFVEYLPTATGKKYFLPEEALVAGSGKPSGEALKNPEGKWQVSGSWSYCSGSEQASLFTAVTKKEGKIIAFVLPVEMAQIHRDWNAIGLPFTCSHSIQAKNAVIPEDHFFDLSVLPRENDYKLSSYPFMLFALACFVPVVVGISRSFWLEVKEFLTQKQDIWKKYTPKRYKFVLGQEKHFTGGLASLEADFYDVLEKSWKAHTGNEEIKENEITEKGLKMADFCFNSCAKLVPELGMQVLDKSHPLQMLWQNLQTAYQHVVFRRY